MVGPTNDTSARPRPSSSATMPVSTPDASGAVPSAAVRSSRHPAPARAASSFADRSGSSSSPTACGPSWSTSRVAASRRACCFEREADVHQPSVRAASNGADHSSRSVRRSTFPDGRRGISSTTTR